MPPGRLRRALGLLPLVVVTACGSDALRAGSPPPPPPPATPTSGTVWTSVGTPVADERAGRPAAVRPTAGSYWTLDRARLSDALGIGVVEVPAPDGRLVTFVLQDAPVLEASLAAAHPEIRTAAGTSRDDPAATVRVDLTALGFHASVRGGDLWFVDPVLAGGDLYVAYRPGDLPAPSASFSEGPVR